MNYSVSQKVNFKKYVLSIFFLTSIIFITNGQIFKNIIITGSISGNIQTGEARLSVFSCNPVTIIGKSNIDNGTFCISCKIEQKDEIVILKLFDNCGENIINIPFFTDTNNLNIEISQNNYRVTGSRLTDLYQSYIIKKIALFDERESIYQSMEKGNLSYKQYKKENRKLNRKKQKNERKINDLITRTIIKNINNTFGQTLYKHYEDISCPLSYQKKIIKAIPDSLRNDSIIHKRLEQIRAYVHTQPGEKYTDVQGITPKGEKMKLSEYVGKKNYVLLNFWSSWSVPCYRDIAELVKLYKKLYNDLEIIGISLDQDKNSWEKGITRLNMSWPQMSDLQGWDGNIARQYGLIDIPQMILIDKKGKIISRFSHEEKLSEKLTTLIK